MLCSLLLLKLLKLLLPIAAMAVGAAAVEVLPVSTQQRVGGGEGWRGKGGEGGREEQVSITKQGNQFIFLGPIDLTYLLSSRSQ